MFSHFLDNLRLFIETTIASLGYTGLALLMVLENIFPPIPSELIIPFAGFLVSEGRLAFIPVLVATTLGTVVGTTLLYYLGFYLGNERLRQILRGYGHYFFFPESSYTQALMKFNQHDKAIVFWSRLVPGLRSITSLPAGVTKMPIHRFLIYTTLGTIIWNVLLLIGGMLLKHNWSRILGMVDQLKEVILIGLAILIVFWIARKWILLTKSSPLP